MVGGLQRANAGGAGSSFKVFPLDVFFFSCKTDYGPGCNTKVCQCTASYGHPLLNEAHGGAHSRVLLHRCDMQNGRAV